MLTRREALKAGAVGLVLHFGGLGCEDEKRSGAGAGKATAGPGTHTSSTHLHGDRVELRRYVPGDSARFIHWKVFGRTRKLMVRVPERALSRARRTVAYLVAGAHDEAAAAAARAAIEEEALGTDWQFAADGSPEATSDRSEAIHKVMASSRP